MNFSNRSIEYNCSEGYDLVGGYRVATCDEISGQWVGLPVCSVEPSKKQNTELFSKELFPMFWFTENLRIAFLAALIAFGALLVFSGVFVFFIWKKEMSVLQLI